MSKCLEKLQENNVLYHKYTIHQVYGETLKADNVEKQINDNNNAIEKELKALDIFKEHELADTLFSYLKVDKTPDNWNWGLPKKMRVTQEEWDLLREVIYGKDRVGD